MKKEVHYRINGFEQIKAFYSWIFNNAEKRVTSQHISLYLFFINQNNRSNWIEWFKCPFDLGMTGACIGNKKTYYKCLSDLSDWGFIKYEKGINEFKAPLIKLEVLSDTSGDTATAPLPTPLPTTLHTPLPTPLPTHIYKLITNNLKPIIDNYENFENFILSLNKPKDESINLDFICSFTDLKNHLKNDTKILAESFCMKRHLTIEQFYNKLDLFLEDQKSKNNLNRTAQDIWTHFINTMNLENGKDKLNVISCQSCNFCKPENQKAYSEFFNGQKIKYDFEEIYDCRYYWERRSHNDTPQILRVELSKGPKV